MCVPLMTQEFTVKYRIEPNPNSTTANSKYMLCSKTDIHKCWHVIKVFPSIGLARKALYKILRNQIYFIFEPKVLPKTADKNINGENKI